MRTLSHGARPVNRDAAPVPHIVRQDSRVDTFARLMDSFDRHDVADLLTATRELRKLGWSVCAVASASGRKGGA